MDSRCPAHTLSQELRKKWVKLGDCSQVPSTGPTEPLRKKKKIEVEKLPVLTDPSLSDEVWLKPVHDTKGQENTCCRKLSE